MFGFYTTYFNNFYNIIGKKKKILWPVALHSTLLISTRGVVTRAAHSNSEIAEGAVFALANPARICENRSDDRTKSDRSCQVRERAISRFNIEYNCTRIWSSDFFFLPKKLHKNLVTICNENIKNNIKCIKLMTKKFDVINIRRCV